MSETMDAVFVVDWSFIFILVMLAVMTTALLVRRLRAKRRARREERRAARRAYQRWLRDSGAASLELPDQHDPPR
jgi:cytochrome c biogenesis protein ResB